MVTYVYHIRRQFLTRWGHISRESAGYNRSPLKIQWIDREERNGGKAMAVWGRKKLAADFSPASLTKGKRPQYLRGESTHELPWQRPRSPRINLASLDPPTFPFLYSPSDTLFLTSFYSSFHYNHYKYCLRLVCLLRMYYHNLSGSKPHPDVCN